MKTEVLSRLDEFHSALRGLKKDVVALETDQVARKDIRERADAIATSWVEDLRSPLEHKFGLASDLIAQTSEQMKQLHRLSRPSNRKSSYLKVLNGVLYKFQDRFVLPIKQTAATVDTLFDLGKLVTRLADAEDSDYLSEAVACANAGFHRAAIVLGWCAATDKMQKKVLALGFDNFNRASRTVKSQTSGRRKHWNKEFAITTLSELQTTVFDGDLVVVLEGLGLLDANQSQRLETCLQYRNHSAHPGLAPIAEHHLVTFFSDITDIVLTNPAFRTAA